MICVECCDVWKVKNEVLEVRQYVSRKGHVLKLFNVLKNERRLRILDALTEKPRSVKELQECLSKINYQHSRSTISHAYINPLLEVGLIKRERNKISSYILWKEFPWNPSRSFPKGHAAHSFMLLRRDRSTRIER